MWTVCAVGHDRICDAGGRARRQVDSPPGIFVESQRDVPPRNRILKKVSRTFNIRAC